jgi:adhesin/invasin
MTLVAAPGTLLVGSLSTLTITVTDQLGYPVVNGTVVSFTTNLGSVSPVTRVTTNGVATATLSSTVAGLAKVTATVGLSSTTAQVTFTPGPPANLSLIAAPSTLQVGNLSTLTVTVTDQFGNPVADGTLVSFSTNLGVATPAIAATVNGVATATLSSTVAGLATVTATVGSLNATALVTFTHRSALADCNTGLDILQWHQPEHSHCNGSRCVRQPSTRRVGAILSHQRPA